MEFQSYGADIVPSPATGPVSIGPVTMPDGTPLGTAIQNADGSVVTTTGQRLGPIYTPDGKLLGYLPAGPAMTFIDSVKAAAMAPIVPVAATSKSGLAVAAAGAGAGFLVGGPIGAIVGGVAGLLLGKRGG